MYSLLEKIRHLASRPVLEFNRFWALDLFDPLTNVAQDTKHEKEGYFCLAFETLCGKADEANNQFHNFLLPLLGDKDQEKVLEVVAKVEKNNHKKPVRQSSRPEEKPCQPLIWGFVAAIVIALGIFRYIVSSGKEIWVGLLVFT